MKQSMWTICDNQIIVCSEIKEHEICHNVCVERIDKDGVFQFEFLTSKSFNFNLLFDDVVEEILKYYFIPDDIEDFFYNFYSINQLTKSDFLQHERMMKTKRQIREVISQDSITAIKVAKKLTSDF